MSDLYLRCRAIKVVNGNKGYATKTIMETFKDAAGKERKRHRHYISTVPTGGTQYVVFKCPSCGRRNKRGVFDAKSTAGNAIVFKCHGCYNLIEVESPVPTKTIIIPGQRNETTSRPLVF